MKPASSLVVMASRQPTDDVEDFFPTPPWGGRAGAEILLRLDPRARSIWESACGAGHLAHALSGYFPEVRASDAYAYDGNEIFDFLAGDLSGQGADWVFTNPPFGDGRAEAFIRRAWTVATRGVAIFARVGLLESVGRHTLLYADCPLTVFAPFSERIALTKGRWEPDASSAAFYAWFFFVKPALRPRRFMARIAGGDYPATLPIPPGTEARLTHANDAELFGAADRSGVAA